MDHFDDLGELADGNEMDGLDNLAVAPPMSPYFPGETRAQDAPSDFPVQGGQQAVASTFRPGPSRAGSVGSRPGRISPGVRVPSSGIGSINTKTVLIVGGIALAAYFLFKKK